VSQLFSLPSFTPHQVWLTPLVEDGKPTYVTNLKNVCFKKFVIPKFWRFLAIFGRFLFKFTIKKKRKSPIFSITDVMKTHQRKKNHFITNMVGAGSPKAKIVKSPTSEI